jgi:hypothetical protein
MMAQRAVLVRPTGSGGHVIHSSHAGVPYSGAAPPVTVIHPSSRPRDLAVLVRPTGSGGPVILTRHGSGGTASGGYGVGGYGVGGYGV